MICLFLSIYSIYVLVFVFNFRKTWGSSCVPISMTVCPCVFQCPSVCVCVCVCKRVHVCICECVRKHPSTCWCVPMWNRLVQWKPTFLFAVVVVVVIVVFALLLLLLLLCCCCCCCCLSLLFTRLIPTSGTAVLLTRLFKHTLLLVAHRLNVSL